MATKLRVLLFALAIVAGGCKDKRTGDTSSEGDQVTTAIRFHLAAERGDLAQLHSLIADGCSPDTRDKNGFTALHTAAKHGQVGVVEFLIARGADVNAQTPTSNGPLFVAASSGRADITKLLVAAGANVNAGKERGYTPLYAAGGLLANQDHEDVVRLLLASGAEIVPGDTRENEALLCFAVERGMHELMQKLLASGASPNTVSHLGTGRSVLGEAVALGDAEAVRLLIAAGADVDKRDARGWVPLQYARRWSRNAVEVLLAEGADIHRGLLVHWFVDADEPEILGLLLSHGADVNQKDEAGRTPLDEILTVNPAHKDMIELLQKHGGLRGKQERTGSSI